MNATSVDIVDMLESDSSLGLSCGKGGNMFVGKEPTTPDNVVTIYDSYGYPPQLTMAGMDEDYYYPAIQIRVRNRDYRKGYDLAHKIMVSLHGRANERWNDTLYTVIYSTSGVALLEWEDTGLCRFLINFNVQRR
jgi:hypothetical protein